MRVLLSGGQLSGHPSVGTRLYDAFSALYVEAHSTSAINENLFLFQRLSFARPDGCGKRDHGTV